MTEPADLDEPLTYLGQSKGLCRACGELVDVRYVAVGQQVYLERLCPVHGRGRALVAESLAWYLRALQSPGAARTPPRVLPRQGQGCPAACGPCELHAQACNLPVFSITNACNLRCPICFTYNRSDAIYAMSEEEFSRHIDFVIEATGSVDLVNITGGEPTLHPRLLALLERARRPEIGRVTLNTNGLTLAADPALARAFAEREVYVILSLDTLDPQQSVRIHGQDIVALKRRALENLALYDVQTTLLTVLIGGVNEDQLAPLAELVQQLDFVRSWTIQTMAYTGQGGGQFLPRRHLPVDRAERLVEEASGGAIRAADFLPLPSAHPLCYGVNYLLQDAGRHLHSFARFLGQEAIARHLADGYLLHPSPALEVELKEAIDRLWSEGGSEDALGCLKDLLRALYPPNETLSVHQRQRLAERRIKTVYIHAHMDEDTYEVGRAMRCPDQVPVNAERLVGACNYNLFYRVRDERFWVGHE